MAEIARTRLPGPGRWEAFRRLFPVPFRHFAEFITDLSARYGPVFGFDLPWRHFACINEPALIKDVLVTQQHAFQKSLGAHTLRLILGEGLLTSEEPLHRKMRRIVQPAFHRARIDGYARSIRDFGDRFAQGLADGATIDVHAAMSALTLRIASHTLLGSDTGDVAEAVSHALHALMHEYPYILAPFGALRQKLPLPATRRLSEAIATLDAIVLALIERRRREGGDRGDALSMLLEASQAERDDRPDDVQLRDEVMTLFLAGHETTANALSWAFYLIARHPDVEARLHRAVDVGDRTYVTWVVREVMRLYPPAWIIGRETLRTVVLANGVVLAPQTTVFVAPLLLHRDPREYADPEAFAPERWRDREPTPFAYLPFGAGARRCIGEEFAWLEAALVLEAIVGRVRLVRDDPRPVGIKTLVTLRPDGPVTLRVVARTSAREPLATR